MSHRCSLGRFTFLIRYRHKGQLPTGLIVTGPNIASQELLFSQVTGYLRSQAVGISITLRSGDAPNLKTALKKLIRDATNQRSNNEDDFGVLNKDGRKLLNYDLEALHQHVAATGIGKVVVAFQDSEAFDSMLLSEILKLLGSWLNRIPFVVLFGIATSVELFHERLPRDVTKILHGAQFDVEQTSTTLANIFKAVVASDHAKIITGSKFVRSLLERQDEHVQSLQTFVMSLKYAYMSHFYANPLSILLAGTEHTEEVLRLLQPEHYESLRMLPSFQKQVETLVAEGETEEARALLDNDGTLLEYLKSNVLWIDGVDKTSDEVPGPFFHQRIVEVLHRLELITEVSKLSKGAKPDFIDLYLKAFDGIIGDSDIVVEALEGWKYLDGAELEAAVAEIYDLLLSWFDGVEGRMRARLQPFFDIKSRISGNFSEESKSKYTLERQQTKTLRTTVIAQRVHLSEQKTAISPSELEEAAAYTEVVDEVISILKSYLVFPVPNSLLFNEIFLYDSKTPDRQAFTPKPRAAIEAALCNPHAYLDCGCCNPVEEGLSSSNPPTVILYQLYLETGGLINVYDLWSAFYAVLGGESSDDAEEEDGKERIALALFYRAVAELKLLGMVKMSRKKTDHLSKTAWMGL